MPEDATIAKAATRTNSGMSLPLLELLSSVANWAAVTFAILAAVCGALALILSIRLGRVKDEVIRAKDEQVRLSLAASQERITTVQNQAETDKRESDEKIAGLNTEASRLKKIAEDERIARVRIEESITWRRLTTLQQKQFTDRVRKKIPGHTASFFFGQGDKEAETFAFDIAAALDSAGWRVFKPAALIEMASINIPYTATSTGSETGVRVGGPTTKAGHALADAVIGELVAFGFDASRTPDSQRNKDSGDTVTIEVKVRPEGPQGEAKLRVLKEHHAK